MNAKSPKTANSSSQPAKASQQAKKLAPAIKAKSIKGKISIIRPTSIALKEATAKSFKKFGPAIKNLAKR